MELQRIPLEEQLKRLEDGIPAHPEFDAGAIQAWAGTPLRGWLGPGEEVGRLAGIMGIPPGQAEGMPYREAAARLCRLRTQPGGREAADEAAGLLALPFVRCQTERRKTDGEGAEDPA